MSDTTLVSNETTPEPSTEVAVDTGEQPQQDAPAENAEQAVEDEPVQNEAAKYRRRLRDTEAERDTLASKLETMQRANVDSHADALGIKPAALWASGVELGDLLGDDGVPDVEKITTAVAAARDTLGIETPKPPSRALTSGAMRHPPREDRWQKAFSPPER